AAVRHFFRALRRKSAANLGHSARLVARLSGVSPAAGKAAVQQLVEGALRRQNAPVFGGFGEKNAAEDAEREGAARHVSLLEINQRFTATVNFTGGVWAVFHAGVIGRGLKSPAAGEETPEEPAQNLQIFLALLLRCCGARAPPANPPNSQYSPPIVNPDAAKAVAAALVEAVCPEAAGGGDLIWPPEEQTRATVERDLRICRRFR
ncbi:INT5 protein, partial [Caloenas nicobarica]|nr:INT5 protein [Caloenas nicobarica]